MSRCSGVAGRACSQAARPMSRFSSSSSGSTTTSSSGRATSDRLRQHLDRAVRCGGQRNQVGHVTVERRDLAVIKDCQRQICG